MFTLAMMYLLTSLCVQGYIIANAQFIYSIEKSNVII
jgi:hypothetical protein